MGAEGAEHGGAECGTAEDPDVEGCVDERGRNFGGVLRRSQREDLERHREGTEDEPPDGKENTVTVGPISTAESTMTMRRPHTEISSTRPAWRST